MATKASEVHPPAWLFPPEQLSRTPSRAHGIDEEREARYRREGADFIKTIGRELNMPLTTVASPIYIAIVFFHRFYMLKSFKEYPRWYMAAACLFVAGKVAEQPKRLKDVLPKFHEHLPRHSKDRPPPLIPPDTAPEKCKAFVDMRAKVLGNERVLLETLCFDLSVDLPTAYLFKYAKENITVNGTTFPSEDLNSLVQATFELIKDSYKTTLCVEQPPQIIAVALMNLATRVHKGKYVVAPKEPTPGSESKPWYASFLPTDENTIAHVSNRVLDVYQKTGKLLGNATVSASPHGSTPGAVSPSQGPPAHHQGAPAGAGEAAAESLTPDHRRGPSAGSEPHYSNQRHKPYQSSRDGR